MQTRPIHDLFGVEVLGVDVGEVTPGNGYPEIRALFEEHSFLLFRGQTVDEARQMDFARLFGPIEDRSPEAKKAAEEGTEAPEPEMPHVSNVMDGALHTEADDKHVQNLRANFLWHTDSTFLPIPALINCLMARVVPSSGGATEFATTRAAFADFDDDLKERLRRTFFHHRYGHSRRKISEDLAKDQLFTMWGDQTWRAVWENPVNGREALYIASHVYAVEGMDEDEGTTFVEDLTSRATQPKYVYTHHYRPGDLLVWDERALLHRGTPWPYEEERTLSSCCVSVRDVDGLESMRI